MKFLFLSPTMPLAIALAIAAAGGFIAGFLIGRNRYKKYPPSASAAGWSAGRRGRTIGCEQSSRW